jgi:hypothetical protein
MVRNSEELGPIMFKIANSLVNNSRLCKLLVNVDYDPYEKEITENEGIKSPYDLIGKNILLVPQVNAKDFTSASKICILVDQGSVDDNKDFKELGLNIIVYTPLRSWAINDLALRPFSIMGEIEKTLKGKRFESLGPIKYHGFELVSVDDDLSGYRMSFSLDVFN